MRNKGEVIVAEGVKPAPEEHELQVAQVLAKHFRCIVEFLQPSAGYKMKTPDIVMNGLMWEIKSPTGASRKLTIQRQFKGLKQSRNLVIDGRRTQLDDAFIQKQIVLEMSRHSRVGEVLFISKLSLVIKLS
ncbi:MAG TPA: hypothetical protein VLE99_02285 [Candidatus Saccharimonadales bacterium]|nr:hypothetical protein [Candidatus Saccharimonadales bacterium]